MRIKFADGHLAKLRERLLADLSKEAFAILLAKQSEIDPETYCVITARFPLDDEIVSQSMGHVTPSKEFIYSVLSELVDRFDVDTLIDVHTHPFSPKQVSFSGIDDRDEINFHGFLRHKFPDLNYASIVFGQTGASARLWLRDNGRSRPEAAFISGMPTTEEAANVTSTGVEDDQFNDRARLALGMDALRAITSDQKVAVVGAGGLGSIVAENLVQMGFRDLVLIDPDRVEFTNLGRLVGSRFSDAKRRVRKVLALKRHLLGLNPDVRIDAVPHGIENNQSVRRVLDCTWIFVCTDNHSSRFVCQKISHSLFIPMISVGVNISVDGGCISDISGEVINCSIGSGYCLHCLGRINHMKIAVEQTPNSEEGLGLVERGYVTGVSVKEPAVKTLNSILASLAVDTLVNEFTLRQARVPILVYESNDTPMIYSDTQTFELLEVGCAACLAAEPWD